MTPGYRYWYWELSLSLFTLLPLMGGRSPHQAFFLSLSRQVLANGSAILLWGKKAGTGLSIMSLPFPEADGIPAEERSQSATHRTEFIFSKFIIMLPSSLPWSFTFQNTFQCVASFYFTLSWQHFTKYQLGIQFTLTVLCHLAKFCLCYSALIQKRINLNYMMLWLSP